MKTLVDGVKKFQSEVFAAKKDLFQRLAPGQNPRALFITCSDSRIDPGLLTQTQPGELFILRNAGNIVPSYGSQIGGTTATIEYAIGILDVKNVIVCGHTDCAVMKGVLDPSQAKDLPSLKEWLLQAEATRQIIRENYAHLKGDKLFVKTIQENVRVHWPTCRPIRLSHPGSVEMPSPSTDGSTRSPLDRCGHTTRTRINSYPCSKLLSINRHSPRRDKKQA